MLTAGAPLLAAAQATHEIHDDLVLEQILDLTIAVAKVGGDARYVEP